MMERLTDYSDDECTYIIGVGNKTCEEFCKYVVDGCKNCYIQQVFKKLADYEDLEEQGLLVRLPADKNAEIYLISSRWTICSKCGSRFDEYNCNGCEYECDSKKEYYVYSIYLSSIDVNTYVDRFGKTIFLTREEAEKKMEEMKAND
jgi:hypothetical protein